MAQNIDDEEKGFFQRLASFIRRNHRFVFLGTDAFACLGLMFVAWAYPSGGAPAYDLVAAVVCLAWIVASLIPAIYKLTHWPTYMKSSLFIRDKARRVIRWLSYVVWAAVALILFDVVVLGFIHACQIAVTLDTNPQDFVLSAIYMIYSSKGIILHGIRTTIELAFFGTIIAFVLALFLVFLRIQKIDRSDNYLVRFFKALGSGFARLYSAIIRGTPMMVQGLIIYYAGFSIVRGSGLSITETQQVWSFFMAGLVTLSLCSAAYMAEVLRASIEAIDVGQLEAARSLGLTQWQAMRTIVFPQGVRNAMPAISNELIINIKDSSVLSVVGVFDLMYATTSVAGIYFRQMELYVAAALIYLLLTSVASKLLNMISEHMNMQTRNVLSTAADVPGSTVLKGELVGHE